MRFGAVVAWESLNLGLEVLWLKTNWIAARNQNIVQTRTIFTHDTELNNGVAIASCFVYRWQ